MGFQPPPPSGPSSSAAYKARTLKNSDRFESPAVPTRSIEVDMTYADINKASTLEDIDLSRGSGADYSYANASMGSLRAAIQAGYNAPHKDPAKAMRAPLTIQAAVN